MYPKILPILALFLSFMILCMGHGLQTVLLPARATLMHYSDFTTGALMSAYYAGFIGGTFLAPGLITRVGHIRVFAAGAAIASAIILIHALTFAPVSWIILRAVYGLCLVHLYTVMESWLNSVGDKQTRGKILSFYMISNFISVSAGQLLFFSAPASGYQLFSLSAILLSLALPPLILSRIPQPEILPTPEPFGMRKLYEISPLGMAGALVAGLMGGAYWGLTAAFILQAGYPQGDIAWFMAISLVGGLLAQLPLGALSDRVNRRYAILIALALIFLASLMLLLRQEASLAELLLWGVVFGSGFHPLYSLFIAHTNDFVPQGYFVRASAGLQLVQSIGAVLGPLLAGLFMHVAGGGMLFAYMALLSGVFAVFTLRRLALNRIPDMIKPLRLLTRTGMFAFLMDPRAGIQSHR
jgi:MFS family permease